MGARKEIKMKKFVLLIRGEDQFAQLSPAEMQATVQKYSLWAKRLRDENRLVDAEGLDRTGRVLTSEGGVVTDGPFPETRELVGGYYIYTAESMDEAVAIGRDCPALGYGAAIEIRPVVDYS
jgi:hypothetical protein